MPNRAQRRKKPQAVSLPKSQEVMLQRMCQNGITPKDLENEYYKGMNAGRETAIKTCYAAVCLAAKEAFGFGTQRGYKLLYAMDKHVCETLSSMEAIDKVFDEMHIAIRFHDPLERIELKE